MTEVLPVNLTGLPVLETGRLRLRAPCAADFAAFAAFAGSARTRYVGGPKSAAQAFEKLCSMIGHWPARGFGRFVLERRADGMPLGHAGPLQLDAALLPDMTWSLWSGAHEGQGYATESVRAVLAWLPGATGLNALRTEIHAENAASQRIAQRVGAVLRPEEAGWMPGAQIWHIDLARVAA